MSKLYKAVLAATLAAALAACGSRAVVPEDNGLPAYRLDDGSLCEAPPEFAALADAASTQQVRSLFLASAAPEAIVASIRDLPPHQNLEAAFYLSCGEYVRGKLSEAEFSRQRRIYQALRLEHLARGIQQWREQPDGFQFPGKVCHFIHNHGAPDRRDVTRLVPIETSVDDCAMHVSRNGGTHVLLGCSEGAWDTRWAQQPLLAGPNGWANRRRSAAGTRYVPEPNCGWR